MMNSGIRRTGLLLIVMAVFLVGCAAQARYTSDEIKDYPLDVQEKIVKGTIMPGMTPQQVRYAWGSPAEVRVADKENDKTKEIWIYSAKLGLDKTWLVFIDGKLTYITSYDPAGVSK
ncbi:MAG: hypothetical protein HQL08_07730 [Nitrospirae bacterium]|nr:hypothetical protein [Nitrospirota bacterium]